VAGLVVDVVALRFDDHAACLVVHDGASDQLTSNVVHGAIEETRVEVD
jgi:hypothetical protein